MWFQNILGKDVWHECQQARHDEIMQHKIAKVARRFKSKENNEVDVFTDII